MIAITSLPLLRLGQIPCKQNSKNVTYRHEFNKNHPTLPRLSFFISITPLYPTLSRPFNSTPLIPHYPTHASLPNPSNYIPPVPLNQTNSTLNDQFRFIIPITLYHTHFALLHPSHTTPPLLLYPIHLTLTHPKCKNKQKIQTRTKIKIPSSTTSTRYSTTSARFK